MRRRLQTIWLSCCFFLSSKRQGRGEENILDLPCLYTHASQLGLDKYMHHAPQSGLTTLYRCILSQTSIVISGPPNNEILANWKETLIEVFTNTFGYGDRNFTGANDFVTWKKPFYVKVLHIKKPHAFMMQHLWCILNKLEKHGDT